MDSRLLTYYETELKHIREMAVEFANEYPHIAGHLGINATECADPYVERLLEGFAYLSARVQLKVDAQFPRFTQHLLNIVYPHFLAPTPSMVMVALKPLNSDESINGTVIPKQTQLTTRNKDYDSRCEYRTAHDVTLWSISLSEVEYLPDNASVVKFVKLDTLDNFQDIKTSVKAAIRLRLKCADGVSFKGLSTFNRLPLYLRGSNELPMQLYEALLSNVLGMVIQPVVSINALTSQPAWQHIINENAVLPKGFTPEDALLPYTPQSFQGYRLLQEYFAFPERYRFVELNDLAQAWQEKASEQDKEIDIVILLNEATDVFSKALKVTHFELFCSPAINLFEKEWTVSMLDAPQKSSEYPLVPDYSKPLNFEVYQVREVTGLFNDSNNTPQPFLPFYHATAHQPLKNPAYYSVIRSTRSKPLPETAQGKGYEGTEVSISLVDSNEAPFRNNFKYMKIKALCTNQHLPLSLCDSAGDVFDITSATPIKVECVSKFKEPTPSHAYRDTTWKLINHLSLNYLSLLNNKDEKQGAATLRELLSLYAPNDSASFIQGIKTIQSEPIVRRMRVNQNDPIVFGRGLKITVTVNESKFKGKGQSVFLLGMVLDAFFAQYVSLNSFIETVLKIENDNKQERIKTWPLRIGQQPLL